MSRLALCVVPLILVAGTATAQDHQGHVPAPSRPAPAATPTPPADPHAGHRPAPPAQTPSAPVRSIEQADPHAGHAAPNPQLDSEPRAPETPPTAADPHAGHDMADAHAGHDMGPGASGPPDVPTSADDPGRPPQPPPPPGALTGPAHAADAIWGAGTMAGAREALRRETGAMATTAVIVDRLELWSGDGAEGWTWDVGGWRGGDIHRFWWKSEGGGTFGDAAGGEVQALYSRAVRPFWDIQAGVRQDFGPGPDATHLVLGVQGLAPYWFEVDAAAFLSTEGDLAARVEAEYDQRITQRLILQPRLEVEASASDVPERALGSGFTHIEAGLRLRYEVVREFAPYIGVEWARDLGRTADLARARGEDPESLRWLVGVKAWF